LQGLDSRIFRLTSEGGKCGKWDEEAEVRNERLSKGFAHRFRPTYPGFPVEVHDVEPLHAAFFKRKPQPVVVASVGKIGNPGNAGANMGHPYGVVET
jgi:hypothetical protein